jgi:flavin reductase (DIM6/NTAB) family NADH-FMN oxidoreductase RutF
MSGPSQAVHADTSRAQALNSEMLRRTFGSFATGVTVVTVGGASPHGMTANSFTAVSLDPPLVLICVERNAIMHEALTRTGLFGVSVLRAGQQDVARYFADRRRPMGMEQFQDTACLPGARCGAPLIADAVAHFECELWRSYDGGDHSIFVGRLLSMAGGTEEDALVFLRGKFGRMAPELAAAPGSHGTESARAR